MELRELAKQICIYNGQKGTEKQIDKCLKSFSNSIELMNNFKNGRF